MMKLEKVIGEHLHSECKLSVLKIFLEGNPFSWRSKGQKDLLNSCSEVYSKMHTMCFLVWQALHCCAFCDSRLLYLNCQCIFLNL